LVLFSASFVIRLLFYIVLAELSLVLLEHILVFRADIKGQLGPYLEAHVLLVASEHFLVLGRMILQETVTVVESLGSQVAAQVLHVENHVVAILHINLVVFVHL